MDTTRPTQETTPQETTPPAARRGRGRPRLQDPSVMVRVRAPGTLAKRLEAALPTPGGRRAALLEAIALVITKHEAAQHSASL